MSDQFTIDEAAAGQRLDIFCVGVLPQYSRARLQRAITEGEIVVNGKLVKPRQIVKAGDEVSVQLADEPPLTSAAEPTALSLPILYEDREVVVVDKPAGLAVHPGQGHETATVASWFSARYPAAHDVGEAEGRAGVVHRLDKETSGVLILAKTAEAYQHLKQQFARRRAHKQYLALVFGIPGEAKGRINRALARSRRNPLRRTIDPEGKEAITEWYTEEKLADRYALLRVWPLTGRTHQIRAHLHFLGFPIVGDALYTYKHKQLPEGAQRQLLHAEKLTITLPDGKRRAFTAPLADDFAAVLESLRHAPGLR